jgi:hypothetical protein
MRWKMTYEQLHHIANCEKSWPIKELIAIAVEGKEIDFIQGQ